MLVVSPVVADQVYYLSLPGLCEASHGELEESDAIVLTHRGMGNHYFDCLFEQPLDKRLNGQWSIKAEARCDNGSRRWSAVFEIVRRENGNLSVFQQSGDLSPIRFYRCN